MSFPHSAVLLGILAAMPSVSWAAPINYGDFSGATVMYVDVTEAANSPGDVAPLFGAPSIVGNALDFDPIGFAAVGSGGSVDVTDGQLTLTVAGIGNVVIRSLNFIESGDYSLFGGSIATRANYNLLLSTVVVTEVDGFTLTTPVSLSPALAAGDKTAVDDPVTGFWNLGLLYDVDAALGAAGVDFEYGATRLELSLDNTLFAASEAGTAALIAKKDFRLTVATGGTVAMPEPSSAALIAIGLAVAGTRRRRRHKV